MDNSTGPAKGSRVSTILITGLVVDTHGSYARPNQDVIGLAGCINVSYLVYGYLAAEPLKVAHSHMYMHTHRSPFSIEVVVANATGYAKGFRVSVLIFIGLVIA